MAATHNSPVFTKESPTPILTLGGWLKPQAELFRVPGRQVGKHTSQEIGTYRLKVPTPHIQYPLILHLAGPFSPTEDGP